MANASLARITGFLVVILVLVCGTVFGGPYTLGPGDALEIRVWDNPDLSFDTIIRPDGVVPLPTGAVVRLSGLEVAAAQGVLEKAYSEWVKKPKVTLAIKEERTIPVSVTGQVRNPGVHRIKANSATAYEAINMAGGLLLDTADQENMGITRKGEPQKTERFKLDSETTVAEGDIIFVPYKERAVNVFGEVARPGRVQVREAAVSLKTLIAQAGGVTDNADITKIKVIAKGTGGATDTVLFTGPLSKDPVVPVDAHVEVPAKTIAKAFPYFQVIQAVLAIFVALKTIGLIN